MPEANYHIVENSTIEKIFISSKAEEEVKGKTKAKEGKDKGKSNGKSKGKPGEIKLDWGKNMLHMQKDKLVSKLTLAFSFQNATSLLMYFLLELILMALSNFLPIKLIYIPSKMVENSTLTNKK